jgi:predicted ATP-dependent serine protease
MVLKLSTTERIDEMKCRKCPNTTNFEIRPCGTRYAHYCKDCSAWVQWATTEEIQQYKLTEQAAATSEDIETAETAPVSNAAEERIPEPCDYCHKRYVIPTAYDGGIVSWINIVQDFCPMCGKDLRNGTKR